MVRPLINRRTNRTTPAGGGSGNDSDTVLLLHCNGDEGNTGHTVTINGTPILNDEQPIVQTARSDPNSTFGNCGYFNGTDAYYTVPDSPDWDIAGSAAQDYTVDFWVKHTDHANTEGYLIQTEDANNSWEFRHSNGLGLRFFVYASAVLLDTGSGGEITDTNWHHIALCKVTSGGPTVEWGIYKDGTQVCYTSSASTDTFTGEVRIGSANGVDFIDGNMADIRISNANIFSAAPDAGLTDTITVPTSPAVDDANTVLLLAMSDLDQGDTSAPTDTSTGGAGSPHTITNVSSKVVGCGWWWSGSMQFDGSTDKLVVPNHADFDFSGDFCVEFFVKFDAISNENVIGTANFTTGSDGWGILVNTAVIEFSGMYSGSFQISIKATSALVIGQRHHIAISRSSGVVKIFQDGVDLSLILNTGPSTAITSTNDLWIGTDLSSGFWFDGALAEVIISDTARYTAAFTPSTKPHVPNANTVLYLPLNGNQALGRSEQHPITIANTGLIYAQEAENSDYKTSFNFDGSSDYITIPTSTDFNANVTNWTIDLWAKFDDHAGTETLICQYEDGSNNWELKHIHGTGIQFDVDSGASTVVTLSGGEITDTNWTHIALCKVANLYGIYKNGTQVAYVSDADTDTFAGSVYIGAFGGPANYFDGYIDSPRIIQSNVFSASPVVGLTDTISVPSAPYDIST